MTEYVYITRHALSDGVRKCELLQSDGGAYFWVRWPNQWQSQLMVSRRYVLATEPEALAAASLQRDEKIKSLQKQIAKLERMTFKIKEATP